MVFDIWCARFVQSSDSSFVPVEQAMIIHIRPHVFQCWINDKSEMLGRRTKS